MTVQPFAVANLVRYRASAPDGTQREFDTEAAAVEWAREREQT